LEKKTHGKESQFALAKSIVRDCRDKKNNEERYHLRLNTKRCRMVGRQNHGKDSAKNES